MRLLFVVRGEPDFERFVAIAAHLQGEELIFVAPDPGTVIGPTIHWALFKSLGLIARSSTIRTWLRNEKA